MREPKQFTVDYGNGDSFECTRVEPYSIAGAPGAGSERKPGGYECKGTINGVTYKLFVENAAPTRVFQVINSIYEAHP